ncbi:hypothetical protein PCE1_004306 [Barthelona sp. PCE]
MRKILPLLRYEPTFDIMSERICNARRLVRKKVSNVRSRTLTKPKLVYAGYHLFSLMPLSQYMSDKERFKHVLCSIRNDDKLTFVENLDMERLEILYVQYLNGCNSKEAKYAENFNPNAELNKFNTYIGSETTRNLTSGINYDSRRGIWTCTNEEIIEKLNLSPYINSEKKIVKITCSSRHSEIISYPLSWFAYKNRGKTLDDISQSSGGEYLLRMELFMRFNRIFHKYVVQTIVHSAKRQGNVFLFFQYDVIDGSYVIMMSVPLDLHIEFPDHPTFSSDFKVSMDVSEPITLGEYLNSLRGNVIVAKIDYVVYSKVMAENDTIPEYTPEGTRCLQVDVRLGVHGKGGQDVAEHILSFFKENGLIDSYSIFEHPVRVAGELKFAYDSCIVKMPEDSTVHINIGTDNGTAEVQAIEDLCDACNFIHRNSCMCHVGHNTLIKFLGIKYLYSEKKVDKVRIPLKCAYNLKLEQHQDGVINTLNTVNEVFDDIGSCDGVKTLQSLTLLIHKVFTNLTPLTSPITRMNTVLTIPEMINVSSFLVENHDLSNMTFQEFEEEYPSAMEDLSICDDKSLMFQFNYAVSTEIQMLQYLRTHRMKPWLEFPQPSSQYYTQYCENLGMLTMYQMKPILQEQKREVSVFSKIQSILSTELMDTFYKYQAARDTCSSLLAGWEATTLVLDYLCGSVYIDVPQELFDELGMSEMTHFEQIFFLYRLNPSLQGLKRYRILSRTNNEEADDVVRVFASPFCSAIVDSLDDGQVPEEFSLGLHMWEACKIYLSVARHLSMITRLASFDETSVLSVYHQVATLFTNLQTDIYLTKRKIMKSTGRGIEADVMRFTFLYEYLVGLRSYLSNYFSRYFIRPEALAAYLIADMLVVDIPETMISTEAGTEETPCISKFEEEVFDDHRNFLTARFGRRTRTAVVNNTKMFINANKTQYYHVRLKMVMAFTFLRFVFPKNMDSNYFVIVEPNYEWVSISKYKGLFAYIINVLCSHYDAKYVTPDSLNDPSAIPYLYDEERSDSENDSVDYGYGELYEAINEEAKRISDMQVFMMESPARKMQCTESTDCKYVTMQHVSDAVLFGFNMPGLEKCSAFFDIVNQYHNTPAGNAGVERAFSKIGQMFEKVIEHDKNNSTDLLYLKMLSHAPFVSYSDDIVSLMGNEE